MHRIVDGHDERHGDSRQGGLHPGASGHGGVRPSPSPSDIYAINLRVRRRLQEARITPTSAESRDSPEALRGSQFLGIPLRARCSAPAASSPSPRPSASAYARTPTILLWALLTPRAPVSSRNSCDRHELVSTVIPAQDGAVSLPARPAATFRTRRCHRQRREPIEARLPESTGSSAYPRPPHAKRYSQPCVSSTVPS